MRGLFSEITKGRNKKKGEKLSTEEPLDRQNPKRKKELFIESTYHTPRDAQLSILGKLKVNFVGVRRPITINLNKLAWNTRTKGPRSSPSTEGMAPKLRRVRNPKTLKTRSKNRHELRLQCTIETNTRFRDDQQLPLNRLHLDGRQLRVSSFQVLLGMLSSFLITISPP